MHAPRHLKTRARKLLDLPRHRDQSLPPSLSLSCLYFSASQFLLSPQSFSFSLCLSLSVFLYSLSMHRQSHPSPSGSASPSPLDFKNSKKNRGSYNCGRCGLPKKGHTCHIGTPSSSTMATPIDSSAAITSSASSVRPPQAPPRHTYSNLRRALSFDDIDLQCESPTPEIDEFTISIQETEQDLLRLGGLPMNCLWEVLRRLPPAALSSAAKVCTGWRETARKLWRAAEELNLRVPARAQLGFAGSVLQKCPNLVRLTLRMERLGSLWRDSHDACCTQI